MKKPTALTWIRYKEPNGRRGSVIVGRKAIAFAIADIKKAGCKVVTKRRVMRASK